MTLTEELETHPIFEALLREIAHQLRYGVWIGGCEADPEGFIREPHTGVLIYDDLSSL